MKCTNCDFEITTETNFCPNCGAKLNQDAQDAPVVHKQELVQVMYQNELYTTISVLAFYTGIGMALVSLFMIFKGFGLFKDRQINPVTVWVTFGVSVAVALAGGLFYFLKFRNRK